MSSDVTSNVSDEEKSSENPQYNPKLDFFSEQFDPLLALRTPNLVVPVSNATTYDNIYKYKSVTDGIAREQRIKEIKPDTKPNPIERKWLPHQLPIQTQRKILNKNILSRMETMRGPLQRLKACVDKREKIKVWTRHSHNIRGYCIAFVVAFDKHWNLALEEVEEVWTRPKRRKLPALDGVVTTVKFHQKILPPPVTIVKSTKKTETCSRHVKQLLLRGEHIAFIVIIPTEQETVSSSNK